MSPISAEPPDTDRPDATLSTRLLRHVDRLRGNPLASRVAALPITAHLYRVSRFTLFEDRWRFALSEALGRHGVHTYRLRAGTGVIGLRHRPTDAGVLDELFWWDFYDPPDEVRQALEALRHPPTVADLGANVGMFGVWSRRRWPGARVIGVEPDPENADVCARTIHANGADAHDWSLIRACAWTADGELLFAGGQGACSQVVEADAPGITTVPAVDAFPLMAASDIIKLDIEGSEWALLADPRFAGLRAAAILLEYHADQAPGDAPRQEAERLLDAAGYRGRRVHELGPDLGIIWAWRAP